MCDAVGPAKVNDLAHTSPAGRFPIASNTASASATPLTSDTPSERTAISAAIDSAGGETSDPRSGQPTPTNPRAGDRPHCGAEPPNRHLVGGLRPVAARLAQTLKANKPRDRCNTVAK